MWRSRFGGTDMSHYESALVCRSGHVITAALGRSPQMAVAYCQDCGASTISACPACDEGIRGRYAPGELGLMSYRRPSYCHKCGAAYPWTQAAREAWREMAQDAEGLTEKERGKLAASIDDLITDTPRTQLAVQRLKQLAQKVGAGAWGPMKEVLVSIASEAAKKGLGMG